jgi:hypothetical protein
MWEEMDRPGYLGTRRDEIHNKWDELYGKGKWELVWQWGNISLKKATAIQIYEDSYYEFFKNNSSTLDWLIKNAADVYDTAITNVKSHFDYTIQETPGTHLHDIAIRRAVLRNGVWFKGDHLMHVRPEKEGEKLSPQLIPFHLPNMIYRGQTKYRGEERDFEANPPWWITMGIQDSVEQFWQQNKILMVYRKDKPKKSFR